jgi:hypothetical protein
VPETNSRLITMGERGRGVEFHKKTDKNTAPEFSYKFTANYTNYYASYYKIMMKQTCTFLTVKL